MIMTNRRSRKIFGEPTTMSEIPDLRSETPYRTIINIGIVRLQSTGDVKSF